MPCADRRDLLLMLATGACDPAEERELRTHLATGCVECAGYMAEAQAVWSQVPMGFATVQPSAAAKQLLNIKLDATRPNTLPFTLATDGRAATTMPKPGAALQNRWRPVVYTGLAAAVAVAITWLTMNAIVGRQRGTIEQLNKQIAEQNVLLRGMSEQVRTASDVIRMLRTPAVKVVDVPATEKNEGYARMMWDGKSNAGLFVGSKIKPAAAGRCYELWLIVGDKPADKLAAGKVEVNAAGDVVMPVVWKDAVHPAVFAVTDEPERESITDPRGPITMVGKM